MSAGSDEYDDVYGKRKRGYGEFSSLFAENQRACSTLPSHQARKFRQYGRDLPGLREHYGGPAATYDQLPADNMLIPVPAFTTFGNRDRFRGSAEHLFVTIIDLFNSCIRIAIGLHAPFLVLSTCFSVDSTLMVAPRQADRHDSGA